MSSFKNFASMLNDLQTQADGTGTIEGSPIEDFLSIAGYETPGGGGGGDSDYSTAEVTLVKGDNDIEVIIPCVSPFGDYAAGTVHLASDETATAILYKGAAEVWSADANVVAVTGDATLDDGIATIAGDCTITFE